MEKMDKSISFAPKKGFNGFVSEKDATFTTRGSHEHQT